MQLEKYITNNSILIIPNNLKKKIIIYLNELPNMYNIKLLTFNDLKKKLLFDYDTKTINYIMKHNNIDYSNALELINNMYYLFENHYDNKKIDNLNNLKNDLINNNLLLFDNYFIPNIKNKNIYIYGFDYISKYNLKLIDLLKEKTNITIIPKEEYNYTHPVYNFEHLNYEIEFIVNDILDKKIDLNHVFIQGINKDNENTIRRIFNNYKTNLNINSKTTLYETKIGQDFFNNIDNYQEYLKEINNNDIKDLIINILNNYYWETDKTKVIDMIEYDFKNTYIKNNKYENAINTTNIIDNYFNDNDYIYIINFNNEYIPSVYKDTDFINDNEKFDFLETTPEKNNIEKSKWYKALKNIKNLTITSSNQNFTNTLKPSSLIKDYNYEVINMNYISSTYSNQSNLYNLGILLDNYQKYNINNKNINNLLATYPNHNYQSYNNKYTNIKLKDNFTYNLSYTKMNTYFECPFKFYCDNILKLTPYETTFDAWLGSLCHHILSKIYTPNFNYEEAKEEFITNNYFDLTNENKYFLNKILGELRIAINYILSFQNITNYQEIETEKRIEITINNINFIGIIDKIMHYDNNIVLIDYKTGTPNIDLRLVNYGLNLQLPTYLYLIKKVYPESNIIGIYLQHILKPNFNKEKDQNENEQYLKSLRLNGYSLGNESYLNDFDPTYKNSEYIKGLKLTSNGFSTYSKVLSSSKFNELEKLVETKINECINAINNANFEITSKYLGENNITCDYCPYKSICFKTEKDNIYLKIQETEGGDSNEMD